jgi:hypothetical protein
MWADREIRLVSKDAHGTKRIPRTSEPMQRKLEGGRKLAVGSMAVGDKRLIEHGVLFLLYCIPSSELGDRRLQEPR